MNYCPAVANGGLTASSPPNYVINSVATVNCDAGYKCSGVSTTTCSLTCTSTKAWTGSCTLITAYCPSTTPLALNTASNLTIGATTTWACITGAACSGTCTSAAPSTCIAGGSWDSICIYVTNWCSPTIANGVVGPSAPSNNIILSTMTLTCNPGYVCSGGSCSATCTAATRTWSKTCDLIAVYCPITNMYASNVLVSSPIGSTVTWACIPGAACSGSCAATCMSGGTWSTQCIPSANYCPSSVVFGALSISSPSGFEVLSTATLSCNTGYGCTSDLGSCLVQCQTNQTWSNSCSFITSFCPSTISYGTITASAYSYQASGTITCTYGAFCGPTGQSSCSVTCGASRSWSESCNPASQWCLVKNGTVSASSPPDNVVGSVATLSCNSGYVCSGGDCHVTCQPNREWSQTCVPSGCEVSNTYGTASTSTPPGYIQGSTVVWTCISGAACNGNPTCSSTCNSTKQWTHLCAPIATSWCSTSITNGGVSISSESSQVLATATLTCSTGYQCSGDCNVVCQENREWSQSCVATPAWCSSKDTFGTLEASTPPNFVVGSTANWNCIVGASCNGEASCVAECTTSHSWSKRCTSIPNWCDNSLPNGRVAVGGSQPSNNVVTSTINILCDLGFVCSPDNCTATCQSDKFWSKQCLLTSCPTIFADNAIVTITSLLSTFNISATIDCIHGYVIPSTGLSQMNTSCISGSGGYIWSSPPTSCTPRNGKRKKL